jgi:ribosome-binding ATPase YchF (GTP1/OBG family)
MLIGIVGKPNVGKSTFFKAATLAEVGIAPVPFTTIKPNEGVGYVRVQCPEIDFKTKCNPRQGFCIDGQRFVPVKLIDVAGLVPGAHAGKGLGNQFLSDLVQADLLIHIVDASGSTNEEGKMIQPGTYDPVNDVKFVEDELDKWFAGMLKENWVKFVRQSLQKDSDKALAAQFYGFKITLDQIKSALKNTKLEGKKLPEWTNEDIQNFATMVRQMSKPIIIIANKIDISTAKENIERLKKEFPDYLVIPCSAESELALREAAKKDMIKYIPGDGKFEILKKESLDENQKKALDFIQNKILKVWGSTGVQNCLNSAVFNFLKYMVIFPGGVHKLGDSQGRILPDAFLLPPGSTALDFAAKIHTDFAKYFIAAINVRTKQKIGRDTKLKDSDVIELIAGK